MFNLRAFGLVLVSIAVWAAPVFAKADTNASEFSASEQQQIVENVDIQGNRRLRDDDLLYYIKTRSGDVYDPAALERDLR